jgi:hypothetical protein
LEEYLWQFLNTLEKYGLHPKNGTIEVIYKNEGDEVVDKADESALYGYEAGGGHAYLNILNLLYISYVTKVLLKTG